MENDRFQSRNIKDKGWFWVDNDAIEAVSIAFGSGGIAVYALLCRYADNDRQECFPSISRLADMCKMNRHRVIEILRRFQDLNIVSIVRKDGRVNVYQMLKVEPTSARKGTSASKSTGAQESTGLVPGEALQPVPREAHEEDLIKKDKIKKKADDIVLSNAIAVVDRYEEVIRKGSLSCNKEAIRQMQYALYAGDTVENILDRVEGYRIKCFNDKVEPKYRYLSCNFFKNKHYKDYDPVKVVEYTKADPNCSECFGSGEVIAPGSGKKFRCFKCRKEIVPTNKEES